MKVTNYLKKHLQLAGVLFIGATSLANAAIQDGEYHFRLRNSGKYLYISQSGDKSVYDDGATARQHTLAGQDREIWSVSKVDDEYYSIINKQSGKALDVENNNSDNGEDIHQWTYYGSDNQLWKIEEIGRGYVKITSKMSGKVVEVSYPGYDENQNVQQWEYLDNKNQEWRLRLLSGGQPEAPQNIQYQTTSRTLSFSWDQSKNADSYNVRLIDSEGKLFNSLNTTDEFITFWDLEPNTEYTMAMQARKGSGFSVNGEIITLTTDESGEYQVYYGSLNNHSTLSDGEASPSEAYRYARDESGLDFFGLADHNTMIDETEWLDNHMRALKLYKPGSFTTLNGFEWTTSTNGNATIVGSNMLCDIVEECKTFSDLIHWLDTPENRGVAFLNSPGEHGENNFDQFTGKRSDKVVGIELFNKDDNFDRWYYSEGFVVGDGLGYYDEALMKDWKLGAAGSDDNHKKNFGNREPYRLAVISENNSRTAIMDALRNRRFYATEDKDLDVRFSIAGSPMGSTVEPGNYMANIKITDGSDDVIQSYEVYKNGISIHKDVLNSKRHAHIFLGIFAEPGDYFYVKVTLEKEGAEKRGAEAITSPIFIAGGTTVISKKITSSSDDAEESQYGDISLTSSDLELIQDNETYRGSQKVALRFTDLGVPKGANIVSAYIQFKADEANTRQTQLEIYGELTGNSEAVEDVAGNISSRYLTTEKVDWSVAAWTKNERTIEQRTADITVLVQEIIKHEDWEALNSMMFIITGEGKRVADSYDGQVNGEVSVAPELFIEYTMDR